MQQSPDSLINQNHVNVSFCANNSEKLIVGGIEADPTEFPHMAAIGFDAGSEGIKWQCGGTLVSEIFVLTAAHCTSTRDWYYFYLFFYYFFLQVKLRIGNLFNCIFL